MPRKRGSDATISLVPMHASTWSGAISTPRRRAIHVGRGVAQVGRADRRRVRRTGGRGGVERGEHDVGDRVDRVADRAVDDAARHHGREPAERVEPVVRVGRRHEADLRHSGVDHRSETTGGWRAAVAAVDRGDEVREATDDRVGQAGPHAYAGVVVHGDEDVALAVQRGEHIAAFVRNVQLDDLRERAQAVAEPGEQRRHAVARTGRHHHGVGVRPAEVLEHRRHRRRPPS